LRQGYHATFGEASSNHMIERLGLERAKCVILTMDEPRTAQRLVKNCRAQYPDLPIRPARATQSTRRPCIAPASHAIPETLEATLQLSEAVLVELGVPMGFVIASIHEKRDEYRETIMQDGGLTEKPKLKSSTLRERAG
jgi:CPA2 family monovalent cation:H+ antiporter-2